MDYLLSLVYSEFNPRTVTIVKNKFDKNIYLFAPIAYEKHKFLFTGMKITGSQKYDISLPRFPLALGIRINTMNPILT